MNPMYLFRVAVRSEAKVGSRVDVLALHEIDLRSTCAGPEMLLRSLVDYRVSTPTMPFAT